MHRSSCRGLFVSKSEREPSPRDAYGTRRPPQRPRRDSVQFIRKPASCRKLLEQEPEEKRMDIARSPWVGRRRGVVGILVFGYSSWF